jgi:two-component system OmpR family response regulator
VPPLLRRFKTDDSSTASVGPEAVRVLVVDDHPDAGRLLGRILRREGYEVAESSDQQVAVASLVHETEPVGAIVASFTTSGTRASLRLLDSIRNHPDADVNQLRVLLVSDQPRQQIFCLQAGADAILLRPYHADDLLSEMAAMLSRAEADRVPYRHRMVDVLKREMSHALDPHAPTGT